MKTETKKLLTGIILGSVVTAAPLTSIIASGYDFTNPEEYTNRHLLNETFYRVHGETSDYDEQLTAAPIEEILYELDRRMHHPSLEYCGYPSAASPQPDY